MSKYSRLLKSMLKFTVILLLLYAGLYYIGRKIISCPEWIKGDTMTGPDGYTYCIMDENGLVQDPYVKLNRTKDINTEETFEELGRNCAISSWLSIIRPADTIKDKSRRLYVAHNHVILGLSYLNKAAFAYDIDKQHFYGSGEIDAMSPFMLIEKDTPLYEPDIFALIMTVVKDYEFDTILHNFSDSERQKEYLPGCPRPEVLQEGLNHPNPEVAELSRWLMEIQSHGLSDKSECKQQLLDYLIPKTESADSRTRDGIVQVFNESLSYGKIISIPVLEKIIAIENDSKIKDKAKYNLGNIRRH